LSAVPEPLGHFQRQLETLQESHLYRSRLTLDGPQSVRARVDGRELLSFCSNDYLGLAGDPRLVRALRQGAEAFGVGAGASHLVNGHSRAHAALEEALAAFLGAESALTFSTGYMANLALAQAFTGRGDRVVQDKLNHASLIDAGRLSRADSRRYAHGDAGAARRALAAPGATRAMLMSDAVFSMDGDLAPVTELAALAAEHEALLVLDDAHGFGVHGPGGRGTAARFGLAVSGRHLVMGTLGKAIGTFGAFVAGDAVLIDTLIQRARSYIYTTAGPPALAEASRAALDIARREDWRRERLGALIERFRAGARQQGLRLMASATPIQPLLVGDSRQALEISRRLREAGILVVAIRPPTVPRGTARLRVALSAAHGEDDVDRLLEALGAAHGAAA